MSPPATQLLDILKSLGESSQFCASGSLVPVLPGLEVEGIGNIGVPISATDAKRMIKKGSQAPYGLGEQTIVDTDVRCVWQLDPEQFSLRNAAWDKFVDGIVQTVREEFGIQQKVRHELYKLLIYETGSFFKPHRDTEKTSGMFATLVVCLPSRHTGGALVVTHEGETRRIEFGGDKSEFNIQYGAFYADCQHEIMPVESGYRVCLVYNLSIVRKKQQPSAPDNRRAVDEIAELLPQIFADDSRDKIAIPFEHQYSAAGLDPRQLKGADRVRMDVLVRAAKRLNYQLFVALHTHWQSGSPDYSTMENVPYHRRRYYDDDEDISTGNENAEFDEVIDESRTLDCWLDAHGRKHPFGEIQLDENEIVTSDSEDDGKYTQEISEATGNAGASMERWYRQGVAVIWPRDRYFRILSREGPAQALPALEEMVAARSPDDDACREFAGEIIRCWPRSGRVHSSRETTSLTTRILDLLDQLNAADLAAQFVHEILPTQCDGSEGPGLARLASRFGWELFAEPLHHVFAAQSPDSYTAELVMPATIFEALCCSAIAMTDERRAVCARLGEELERVVERWDSAKREPNWHRQQETRTGIVESVFRAYSALDEIDRLGHFVAHVLSNPKRYEVREILIPAVKSLHSTTAPDSASYSSFERLLHHCLTELRAATATPVEPPEDWSREATVDCKCVDCRELVRFLRDPTARVHRFARRQELRQHLHQQIDRHRCDLTHITERKGSPQTLVCTKSQASFERRLAQFNTDVQLRSELESLGCAGMRRPVRNRKPRKTKVKPSNNSIPAQH